MSAKLNIQNAVYLWCTTEFPSVTFVFQYQDYPIVYGLFGVINVISATSIAQDEAKYYYQPPSADNFIETVGGVRKVLVSIHLYRTGAYDTLSQLKASLRRGSNVDLLWNNGLSLVESSDIRDVSEVVSALWEERYQMDVTFYANSQYDSTIVRIAEVPIEGTINNGEPLTRNFTISS